MRPRQTSDGYLSAGVAKPRLAGNRVIVWIYILRRAAREDAFPVFFL